MWCGFSFLHHWVHTQVNEGNHHTVPKHETQELKTMKMIPVGIHQCHRRTNAKREIMLQLCVRLHTVYHLDINCPFPITLRDHGFGISFTVGVAWIWQFLKHNFLLDSWWSSSLAGSLPNTQRANLLICILPIFLNATPGLYGSQVLPSL